MKIFNWVHKTFHHNALKDGFASNLKKTEPNINNGDSHALLKQVALDVLNGWEDGILTIGTLGYDPLKSFNQQRKEYLALGSKDELDEGDQGENILVDGDHEEDNYNADHEELNPLMHTTFEHNFEEVDANASKEEAVMTLNEVLLTPPMISHEVTESNDVDTDQKKKKGERITLADLFLADSDKIKLDSAKVLLESIEKPSLKAKHALPTFAKKFIPRVKDNPHPIKNIQKLMKKMLKRKIHPELDAKNHKPESQKPSATGIIDNQKHEANDSISLLPI